MRIGAIILISAIWAGCGGSSAEPVEATSQPAASSQVERGTALYAQECASCHGDDGSGTDKAPAVVGPGALPLEPPAGAKRDVQFATAGDVYRWVRQAMPGDDPGSLTDAEYAAILAFALQANGVDVSGVTLDEARADAIELH